MGMRLRMGPVSVSSRGRVGVRVGPVSAYGGGRRRRRSSSNSGGGGILIGIVAIAVVVAVAVKYWYVALPLLVVGTFVTVAIVKASAKAAKNRQEEAARLYREEQAREAHLRAVRHAADMEARARAEQAWLAGPPPALRVPGRFTDKWFAENVPGLHPGQVPVLLEELRDRGWTDERIARRVQPYLLRNPHYAG